MNTRTTYGQLTLNERYVIEKLVGIESLRYIAEVLTRSVSTVSEEVQRNKGIDGRYVAKKAHHRAYLRQYRKKRQCLKVALDSFLSRVVEEKLRKKWTPKNISGWLKRTYNIICSAKAIYKWAKSRGLEYLLFWGWNKRKGGRKKYRYGNPKDERKYIDQRPPCIGSGHYEMDFIVSKESTWVLLVVVDICTRYARVVALPNRKHATVSSALSVLFGGGTIKSITTDNDIAFTGWRSLENLLCTQIYFTHPYHSWEKGLVENTNRWIRCFVAKRRDISTVTEEEFDQIHAFLNDRPRECIGYMMSSEYYWFKESVRVEG